MEERPAKQVRLSEPSSGGDSGAAAPAAAGESSTITQRAAAEGWSASVGGRVGRRYVPVGAICCGSRHTQPIRKALEGADWLKKTSQRIHAYRPPAAYGEAPEVERRREMAIHVSPVAAAALDAAAARVAEARPDDSAAAGGGWGAELPPELGAVAALLHGGEARWLPGLRIGDAIDAGGLGPTWHLIPADIALEEERLAATQAEEARKGGSFAFIELFAGIGGFRVAMEPLGGRCVFASEIGVEERLTYFQNFGRFPAGDITETPSSAAPAHAMLTAGFPCQSFCKAGLKTGFNDARGELFFEVLRFARAHTPPVLLLENVPHLVKIDDGAALRTILEEVAALGYATHHRVLSSRNVVPQERKRLYIVGFRDPAHHAAFRWPEPLTRHYTEVPDLPIVRDILEDGVSEEYTVNPTTCTTVLAELALSHDGGCVSGQRPPVGQAAGARGRASRRPRARLPHDHRLLQERALDLLRVRGGRGGEQGRRGGDAAHAQPAAALLHAARGRAAAGPPRPAARCLLSLGCVAYTVAMVRAVRCRAFRRTSCWSGRGSGTRTGFTTSSGMRCPPRR